VVQEDAGDLAVSRLVPMDAVRQTPRDVTPHVVVEIHHVEPVVGGCSAGEVVGQQHVVAKDLGQEVDLVEDDPAADGL